MSWTTQAYYYPPTYFSFPASIERAEQEGLCAVENADLTPRGLVAKLREMDETDHGVDSFVYDDAKRLLEQSGVPFPEDVRRLGKLIIKQSEQCDISELPHLFAESLKIGMPDVQIDESSVDDRGGTFTANGTTYRFFWEEEIAENVAVEQVTEDLNSQPEMFNQDWLLGQIDGDKTESFMREAYDEWNQSYANDINTERSSKGYGSRLVDEMVDRGIIEDEEASSPDFDPESKIDEFVEAMTEEKIQEGDYGLSHYRFNFGDEATNKLISENGLIDINEAASDAVSTDGWPHFLSHYDGSYETLRNGIVYFQE